MPVKGCKFRHVLSTYGFQKWLIDWLIIYGFTSRSRIFHLYGDVTIAGEGLQILGLCSALRAFEQRGIFIVPHLLWHGVSVFRSHPKDRPIQSPLTARMGMQRIYSNPDPPGGFRSEGSYKSHRLMWYETFVFNVMSNRPVILTSAWSSLESHNLSKCASGASESAPCEFDSYKPWAEASAGGL
jgi:hypothetical protein